MTIKAENTRLVTIISKEDDEVLARLAGLLGSSKSALVRDMISEFVGFLKVGMELAEGDPDQAMKKMVRLGMVKMGDALSDLLP